MRIAPDELARHLSKGELPSVILLHGDEPLLIEESAAQVREAARSRGFTDRIPLSAESGFDWNRLTGSSQTLSLFAERKLIELRLPTGRPGDAGTQAFVDYLAGAGDDVCLLVITGRLDARAKQAKWVKTLDKAGWALEHRALAPGQFQGWFQRRLRDRGLVLERETVQRMCHFLEGNLLAAAQEIDRVALFAGPDGRVDPDAVAQGMADHARFNVYAFIDACLNGDGVKALRILKVLKNEATEPVLVSWVVAKDLRLLVRLEHGLRKGGQKGSLFKSHNIWSSRAPLFNVALGRLGERELNRLTRRMARTDRVLKGRESGDIWRELDTLALMMCDPGFVPHDDKRSHAAG